MATPKKKKLSNKELAAKFKKQFEEAGLTKLSKFGEYLVSGDYIEGEILDMKAVLK
ncbi:MAG: hypothetical protein R3Y59_01625 [bacterium]